MGKEKRKCGSEKERKKKLAKTSKAIQKIISKALDDTGSTSSSSSSDSDAGNNSRVKRRARRSLQHLSKAAKDH